MVRKFRRILLLLVIAVSGFATDARAYAGDVIFVDALGGNDTADGRTEGTALRTLQRAASLATPGTVVHVLPGIYRESVRPAVSGTATTPIVYVADQGSGTVAVRGSEPASALTWTRLSANTIGLPAYVAPSNVWMADLSAWGLDGAPRFVVALDATGEVQTRLSLAREPDWHVETPWRYAEYWWTADGGWDVSGCDPSDPANDWNCDLFWRCDTHLTDRSAFAEPLPGIEDGDLTSLGDITGAELVALDAKWGHYLYRRRIIGHEVGAGRIALGGPCLQDGGEVDPGLGWGTKYYVEDHPGLLDTPGEWWYDAAARKLFLWPPTAGSPATQRIEISRRQHGLDLTDRSYITLDGLTVELFNGDAVHQANYWAERSHGNTLRNLVLRYANQGVLVQQTVQAGQSADNVTRNFTLENSEIAHMDTHGLFVTPWWDGAPSRGFPFSGIYDTVIRGNEFHHLGFRTDLDDPIGVKFQFADWLRFEDNYVHDVAHNGVQFLWSVVDSDRSYDVPADAIKIGDVLVKDNTIENVCQLTTDCGALKFWGQPPDNHIFRDVLVTGNILRDVHAWSYVAKQRVGWWLGGEGCIVQGQAGFGLYLDYASGIHAFRNVAYNNAYGGVMLAGTWRDGDLIFVNNTIANSLYGFRLSGVEADTHGGSVNTQIRNNILAGNEGYAIYQCTANATSLGRLEIDHNLYFNNGWRSYDQGGVWTPGLMAIRTPTGQAYYPGLVDVQAHPYQWEMNGLTGDPRFLSYAAYDHDPYDGSWPDFRLVPESIAIDRGGPLPASLAALLSSFGLADSYQGAARDVGWQEAGFLAVVSPQSQGIAPGGEARYTVTVRLGSTGLTEARLVATNPDPRLALELSPMLMNGDGQATLLVRDRLEALGGGAYRVPILVTSGEMTQALTVTLLIATSRVFLPVVVR